MTTELINQQRDHIAQLEEINKIVTDERDFLLTKLDENEAQKNRIAELEREKAELVAQVEVLNSKNFELTCYRVDVIRCLKTIAFNHNHAEIIRYQPLARALMDSLPKDKELNQIKAEAVKEFASTLAKRVEVPDSSAQKIEYYKAAIRHVLQFADQYASSIVKGE